MHELSYPYSEWLHGVGYRPFDFFLEGTSRGAIDQSRRGCSQAQETCNYSSVQQGAVNQSAKVGLIPVAELESRDAALDQRVPQMLEWRSVETIL